MDKINELNKTSRINKISRIKQTNQSIKKEIQNKYVMQTHEINKAKYLK